ncbi:MAG: hypothetical protein M1565_03195 [Actinobacteria bacterium]|nr:hypothetical protein [Actinomycetota bacterium]
MWMQLSDRLQRFSTGQVALFALVIFLLFTASVLPDQAAEAEVYAGAAGSPDLSLFYTADDLYEMAAAYGEDGRQAYVRARFTFDLIWPLVYTLFLGTAISWVYGKAFSPHSPWQRANLAPVAGMLLDYLENMATSAVMMRYPDPTPVVDVLAGVVTTAKWAFVGGSFALLVAGVGLAAWRWARARAAQ